MAQRGSEIQTSLDFEWSKRGWVGLNGLDFEWDLKFGSQNHLKSEQKHPYFEWISFQMVGTIAKAQPKSRFKMFSIFQIVGFKIPSVMLPYDLTYSQVPVLSKLHAS